MPAMRFRTLKPTRTMDRRAEGDAGGVKPATAGESRPARDISHAMLDIIQWDARVVALLKARMNDAGRAFAEGAKVYYGPPR